MTPVWISTFFLVNMLLSEAETPCAAVISTTEAQWSSEATESSCIVLSQKNLVPALLLPSYGTNEIPYKSKCLSSLWRRADYKPFVQYLQVITNYAWWWSLFIKTKHFILKYPNKFIFIILKMWLLHYKSYIFYFSDLFFAVHWLE